VAYAYCTGASCDHVSIAWNTGNGTLAAPVNFTLGHGPGQAIAVDLDGDGRPELVTADFSADTVSIAHNLGGRMFDPPIQVASGFDTAVVAAADLDDDGRLDLITANDAETISVLYNRGGLTFAPQQMFAIHEGAPVTIAAIGDPTHTGHSSIFVGTQIGSNDNLSVFPRTCWP
jgi:hypothetical protein